MTAWASRRSARVSSSRQRLASQTAYACGQRRPRPFDELRGRARAGGAGELAAFEGEHQRRDALHPKPRRQRRLLVDIDLDQPHGRFQQRGGALELGTPSSGTARTTAPRNRSAAGCRFSPDERRNAPCRAPPACPSNSASWHWPQRPPPPSGLASLARGTRLIVSQCGQTICSDGSICCSFSSLLANARRAAASCRREDDFRIDRHQDAAARIFSLIGR